MQHEGRNTTETMVLGRLYEAADDLGRLRKLIDPEPGGLVAWRHDRLASHIEALIGVYTPTAAELVACTYPGDDATAVVALAVVDDWNALLRRILGYTKAAA